MPKIAVAEASGYVLNVLLALVKWKDNHPDDTISRLYPDDDGWVFEPSRDWKQGMPLIDEVATKIEKRDGLYFVTADGIPEQVGRELLEAGLRSYLVVQSGPEISVSVLLGARMIEDLKAENAEIPPSLAESMPGDSLLELCLGTDTEPEDWEAIDGPQTGVGIENWYRRHDGTEAYVCNDQGNITFDLNEVAGERQSG